MLIDENAVIFLDHADVEAPVRATLDVEDAAGRIIHIAGVYAILRFLARGRNLYPECDAVSASHVDSLLDIHNDVMQAIMQPMSARECMAEIRGINMQLRDRTWLVGEKVSIADAAWAILVDAILTGGTRISLDISECRHIIEHQKRTFAHFNINPERFDDSPTPESIVDDAEEDNKTD